MKRSKFVYDADGVEFTIYRVEKPTKSGQKRTTPLVWESYWLLEDSSTGKRRTLNNVSREAAERRADQIRAAHVWGRFCYVVETKNASTNSASRTGDGVTKLQSYDWPGNVRELRNVVERAVILARGGALEFDLPISGEATAPPPRPGAGPPPPAGKETPPKFLTEAEMERFERDNLVQALEAANWKISGPDSAAELLGIKPTTLLSRMTKWGLKKPER